MATPLRILCFGDSLTSGYFCYGAQEHAYSNNLRTILVGNRPESEVVITTNGVAGDVAVSSKFRDRLQAQLLKGEKFDWMILLGGTNDLAYGVSPQTIFDALKSHYELAISRGINVMGMTVPECGATMARTDRARNDLNNMILSYKHNNYHPFDLRSKIPYHSLSAELRERYWDDGLHLTDKGYDWMGGHIANALQQLIMKERLLETAKTMRERGMSQSTKTTRTRPNRQEEVRLWDEEGEDLKDITQGYVVVRNHDLD